MRRIADVAAGAHAPAAMIALLAMTMGCAGRTMVESKTGARFVRPPLVERAEFAVVRAHDRARAREVAALVDEFLPSVAQLLIEPEGELLVWCMDEDLASGGRGLFANSEEVNAVFIGPIPSEELELVVAHELGHWCFASYDVALPIAIEEGVCDEVAWRAVHREGDGGPIRLEYKVTPSFISPAGALRLDRDDWFRIPEIMQVEARFHADVVVRALGLEVIAELRERARREGLGEVPPEWFEELLPESPAPAPVRE